VPTAAQLLRLASHTDPATDTPAPADTELLRRYTSDRDEAAFAVLVRRNGPLVLRACRHVLGEAAADDAFQATFLLLARSARRLTRPGSLAGWLHAAAVKIARNARRGEDRRRKREATGPVHRPTPIASDELSWREVREVLDAEIAALPECDRLPVVLCCVQELSYEEAARRAGCPVGTLRNRLDRGKERLRRRLARYGLPLAAPVLVLGSPPPVPAALVEVTVGIVRTGTAGKIPPALAGLLPTGRSGVSLLLASAVAAVAALSAVLAAGGRPVDPPKAEPPRPANATAAPPPRADLFGDPLPDGVLVRLGTTRSRAGVHSFGLLPDGTVVTVGPNLDIRTWSPTTDQSSEPVLLALDKPDPYLCPQVSADGRFIAAGTQDKVVVWERSAPDKPLATFELKYASRLALSPDGSRLAVLWGRGRAKDRGRVALCDVRAGTVRDLEPMTDATAVRFSGDGRRLLTGENQDRQALIWDVPSGKLLAEHKGKKIGGLPVALDRTGSVFAVLPYAWGQDRIGFFDTTTGQPVEKWTGPEVNGARFLTFAPDGKTVLIGSHTGIRWWDPAAGKLIRQFDAPSAFAVGRVDPQARLSPDGKLLVSHTGQTLFRWDAVTGKPLFPATQTTGHTEGVRALGVSPDGKRVATLGLEVGLRVWDAASGRQLWVLPARNGNESNIDFSPDGRFVFAPSQNRDAVVKWDLTAGKEVSRYTTGKAESWGGDLLSFRLAPDGKTLHTVAGREESRFVSWDVESGRALFEKVMAGGGGPGSGVIGFSPDGRWGVGRGLLFPVAVGPGANTLAGAKLRPLGGDGVFSADSRLIALTTFSGPADRICKAVVVEVATGAVVREMPVRWTTGYAFHPDGRSLTGAEADGLVFWDLTTGKEFVRRKAHALHLDDPLPFAWALRYTPDGTRLVTGHIDTTALVWEAPARPKTAKALSEKERVAAWEDLGAADGAKGWAAVWALADDPGAVPFLRERVRPVEPLPAKEFEKLLEGLNAEEFADRAAAAKALGAAGERAAGQLRAALGGDTSAEQRAAVGKLLTAWRAADQAVPTGERLRVVRAVAALELVDTADARQVLAGLAGGAADATATRAAKQAVERTGR
jgi:RNA polymerase sigma factor (sigma-70 family)